MVGGIAELLWKDSLTFTVELQDALIAGTQQVISKVRNPDHSVRRNIASILGTLLKCSK
jgi:hypothetical protein